MQKFKQLFNSEPIEQILNWSFSILCAIFSLIFFMLTITNVYTAISQGIVFAITAFLFCPKVKTPLAVKVVLGILLVFAT
ncbi:MAG: hypothetical protein RLZZ574_1227 [Cyanobacteriota bacterium]|jgi:O-antigen ligase